MSSNSEKTNKTKQKHSPWAHPREGISECSGLLAGFIPKFWWDKEIPLCSPSWRQSLLPCRRSAGFAGVIRKDLLRVKSACLTGPCEDTRRTRCPSPQAHGSEQNPGGATRSVTGGVRLALSRLCFVLSLAQPSAPGARMPQDTHRRPGFCPVPTAGLSPDTGRQGSHWKV